MCIETSSQMPFDADIILKTSKVAIGREEETKTHLTLMYHYQLDRFV